MHGVYEGWCLHVNLNHNLSQFVKLHVGHFYLRRQHVTCIIVITNNSNFHASFLMEPIGC